MSKSTMLCDLNMASGRPAPKPVIDHPGGGSHGRRHQKQTLLPVHTMQEPASPDAPADGTDKNTQKRNMWILLGGGAATLMLIYWLFNHD